MLRNFFLFATQAAFAAASVTSGLYRISSNFVPQYVITQSANKIAAYGAYGYPEQVWSLIVTNHTASIQNLRTQNYIALAGADGDGNATIVPSVWPFRWFITPDTSAAQIASGRKALAVPQGEGQLVLASSDGTQTQRWTFVATVPLPHAYRIWNEALNLNLDQVGDAFRGSAANGTQISASQVWHVAGTSAGGGLPTLQNAGSGAFLAITQDGRQPTPSAESFSWSHNFVGGQMTLHDTNSSTLTVGPDGTVLMSPANGTQQSNNQTWVFIPVA